MSCLSHSFITYNWVTKSMCEAENCVSVHLLSAASSSVSSTEGRRDRHFHSSSGLAGYRRGNFTSSFFPLCCLKTPRISRGSGSNFISHSYRDGCQSCYWHSPLLPATHLLEYTCCATGPGRTRTLGHKNTRDREARETAKCWWRVKMTPWSEMGTCWVLGKAVTKATAWKLPMLLKWFNSIHIYYPHGTGYCACTHWLKVMG